MNNITFLISLKREIVNDLYNLNKTDIMHPPNDEQMMRFYNLYNFNTNQYREIRQNLDELLRNINISIDEHCEHEWEEDLIELSCGTLKPIKYCIHCELNYERRN